MGGCFRSDEWQVVVKEERDVVYDKLLILLLKKKEVTVTRGVKYKVSGNGFSKSDLRLLISPRIRLLKNTLAK